MAKAKIWMLAPMAAALALGGCGDSSSGAADGAPGKAAPTQREQLSQENAELPQGMRLFSGQSNNVTEFDSRPAGEFGGKIITYSTIGMPWTVREFYETEGTRNGMQVVGRVSAGAVQSVDLRRMEGDAKPHTFSVQAVHKSEYTNVTIMIDVTK